MKIKIIIGTILSLLVLSSCGQKSLSEPITLLTQDQKEVTFPLEKPAVFFFITTYTWGICQQQLVQLHENFDMLKEIDAEMYIVSKDLPEEQQMLFNDLKNHFGHSITFISDPDLVLIDFMGMKNGTEAYRGFGMMDKDGKVMFKTINDHWGEEFDSTVEEIKEGYKKLK